MSDARAVVVAEERDVHSEKRRNAAPGTLAGLGASSCREDPPEVASRVLCIRFQEASNASASHTSSSCALYCRVRSARLDGRCSGPIEFRETDQEFCVSERRQRAKTTPGILRHRVCRRYWARPAPRGIPERIALREHLVR